MDNFKVKVSLATPVIASGWLTLDSILAALIYRKTGSIEAAHRDIPLMNTDGLWHGSAAIFSIPLFGETVIKRGFSMWDLESDMWLTKPTVRRSVDQKTGPYKASVNHYKTINAPSLSWLGSGDLGAVEALLQGLDSVGKKTGSGYGKISGIELIDVGEDFSIAIDERPMRQVPIEIWRSMGHGEPEYTRIETWKPAYFEGEAVECAVPPSVFERPVF